MEVTFDLITVVFYSVAYSDGYEMNEECVGKNLLHRLQKGQQPA